jgi:hypothetical protein
MKLKTFFRTALLLSFIVFFSQCKKDLESLLNPNSTVTFINPTYTTISINFNGESKTIPAGGSAIFTGTANTSSYGSAQTSGQTTSGTQVGALMTWTISQAFPSGNGNIDYTLNIGSDYFFLKVINQSSVTIQKIYVNYGLVTQTLDNISIPNNGTTYNIGYYKAYTNSNVRAESGATYWYWNPLSLPFNNNQSKVLTAL